MKKRLLFIILLTILSFGSANAAEKLSVFVSIVPQKYFVQQIGKDMVDVNIMVKPGASPATYEPKPRQMAELSNAKLYFSIGVPFEKAWLKKIAAANPDMKVIHTDDGIEKIEMAAHHHHDEEHHGEEEHHDDDHKDEHHKGDHHDEKAHKDDDHHDEKAHKDDDHHGEEHHGEEAHKDEDHHDHSGPDPHIWISPKLVKIQAETILRALQAADPSHKKIYEANFNSFVTKIDALDQELKQILAGKKGMQFMVFHPSWGYLAHDYGLKQVPIEIQGKDPKPAQLKELIKHAKEDGIKVIFVQPQFSTKSAKTVAREIGGQVAYADPLAEDWMNNLRMIAEKFKAVLK